MIAWRELYFTPQTFQPSPKHDPQWNRGAYLVEGLAHCSACHSPRNILGAIKNNAQWTGAEIDGWFALSLGNDLAAGLADWSEAELVKFLNTGTGRDGATVLGPMALVVKNSTSHITDADLKAMAHYLKTLPPAAAPGAELSNSSPTHAKHKKGAVLYLDNCAACHKARGVGVPQAFPPLNGNPVVNADSPADIIEVVLRGIPARNNYPAMPGFAATLNDKEVAELVNYIRTGWENRATANATAKMVEKRR
jgi:mono/diheme cytochrome c family protein